MEEEPTGSEVRVDIQRTGIGRPATKGNDVTFVDFCEDAHHVAAISPAREAMIALTNDVTSNG